MNLLTSTILAVCLAVGFTSCFDEKSNLSVATEGEGEEGESEGPVIVGEGEGEGEGESVAEGEAEENAQEGEGEITRAVDFRECFEDCMDENDDVESCRLGCAEARGDGGANRPDRGGEGE